MSSCDFVPRGSVPNRPEPWEPNLPSVADGHPSLPTAEAAASRCFPPVPGKRLRLTSRGPASRRVPACPGTRAARRWRARRWRSRTRRWRRSALGGARTWRLGWRRRAGSGGGSGACSRPRVYRSGARAGWFHVPQSAASHEIHGQAVQPLRQAASPSAAAPLQGLSRHRDARSSCFARCNALVSPMLGAPQRGPPSDAGQRCSRAQRSASVSGSSRCLSACDCASTSSLVRPRGNAACSPMYSSSHGAPSGRYTFPAR